MGGACVVLDAMNTADPATRTYRARYILSGGGEDAPLGATVTLRLKPTETGRTASVDVPLGALFDVGHGPAVWSYDADTKTVSPRPVTLGRMRARVVRHFQEGVAIEFASQLTHENFEAFR